MKQILYRVDIALYVHPKRCTVKFRNGNRTEWSPIGSVIIRGINRIGRPRSGSPICLITSMITDPIGRHEVLLPINRNFNKICDIIGYFLNQNTRNSKFCFASSEKKKPFKRARDGAYCPINYLGMTRINQINQSTLFKHGKWLSKLVFRHAV